MTSSIRSLELQVEKEGTHFIWDAENGWEVSIFTYFPFVPMGAPLETEGIQSNAYFGQFCFLKLIACNLLPSNSKK